MLNEEKIRLMTKAASFEAGEGKKALEMNRFYKGDYISLHLIGAWFSYTVAFCLCVSLWAFYKMEYLMTNLHKMDLAAFGKGLALLYLALLGIYLVIQYVVYYNRYQENRKFLQIVGRLKDRQNRYFDCPKCHQLVRVPRGKGKISIPCRNCGTVFQEKT